MFLQQLSLNTEDFLNVSVLIEFEKLVGNNDEGKNAVFFLGEVLKNDLQAAKKKSYLYLV